MFEQDYIMRLIKEMVRAILKLLFNIDSQSPILELYDLVNVADLGSLEIALLFYSYLNDKTDEFLEANDFSRAEIKWGLEYVTDAFGLNSIAKIFLTDFT